MKVLVPFKSVPQTGVALFGAGWSSTKLVINAFDEIAIEEALRMRERGEAAEVTCVTVGPAAWEEQARTALAMGCDRALRVDDSRPLDPFAVARILKAVVVRESPSLVILGKQAVDDDSGQVGPMLAALLSWPQATFISKVELDAGRSRARCTRETDGGLETIDVRLPAVLTTDLRLNQPRYVSLPGLVKARKKTIAVLSLAELDVSVEPRATVVSTEPTPRRSAGARVDSVEELVRRLREEAKVI